MIGYLLTIPVLIFLLVNSIMCFRIRDKLTNFKEIFTVFSTYTIGTFIIYIILGYPISKFANFILTTPVEINIIATNWILYILFWSLIAFVIQVILINYFMKGMIQIFKLFKKNKWIDIKLIKNIRKINITDLKKRVKFTIIIILIMIFIYILKILF